MEHLQLTRCEPLQLQKLHDMVQFDGIGIVEGVWTDSLGRTLKYTPEVVKMCVNTLLGKPIAWPHTTNDDDMRKVRGVVTETWEGMLGDRLACFYRGLVSDGECGSKILAGDLGYSSIEADFEADESQTPALITKIDCSAVTPTNRPACKLCQNQGCAKRSAVIKLEEKKKMTDGNDVAPEQKKIELMKKIDALKNELDTAFPKNPSKTWADMTDDERYGAATLFFKAKGYPLPTSFPEKTKNALTGKEEWTFPEGYPEKLKNEILGLETKVAELTTKTTELGNEVSKRDTDEVKRLYNEIKEMDKDFNVESVTKMEAAPARQKIMLESYLDNLKRIKPRIGPISQPEDKTRMEKIAKEAFGVDLAELEAELAKEVSK